MRARFRSLRRPGVPMKLRLLALLVSTSLPFASGCAADEIDPGGAAYPEPIGYTPPQAAGQPSPRVAPAPEASGTSSSDEVVVGGDDESHAMQGQGAERSDAQDLESPDANGPGFEGQGAEGPGAADPGDDQGADSQGEGADGDVYADNDPSALSDFRAPLDPYGAWTQDPTYGTVWVPSPDVVGDDFTPYVTGGHWAYDDDYLWVSDYDWGWAPFHYGRWARGDRLGWEWIPGRRYAGAWVSWRYGERGSPYVGWAPRAPTWGWRDGLAVRLGSVPSAPYAFVGARDLFGPSLGSHVIAGPAAASIVAHTRPWATPSSGRLAVAGPGRSAGQGPPPSALNLPSSAVVHSSAGDRGILQAQAFARPSTAVALGARAPQRSAGGDGWAGSRRASTTLGSSLPSRYAATAPSHFGGRFGAGFAGSPGAQAPMMRSPSYSQGARAYPGAPNSSSTYRTPAGAYGRSRGGYGGYYRSPGASLGWGARPSGAGGTGQAGPGASHGSGMGGGFHGTGGGGGSHGGRGGGFRGGGGNRGGGGRR